MDQRQHRAVISEERETNETSFTIFSGRCCQREHSSLGWAVEWVSKAGQTGVAKTCGAESREFIEKEL